MKRNNTKTNAKRKPYTLKIRVNYKSDNESDRRKNVTKAVRNFIIHDLKKS